MRRASCTQFSRNGLDYRNPVPGGPVTSHPAYPVRWSARTHDQQVVPSPRMFQGGRNYLSRARLGYTFFLLPLLHERVCSMNAAKFKIGEFVVYRIMRGNQVIFCHGGDEAIHARQISLSYSKPGRRQHRARRR